MELFGCETSSHWAPTVSIQFPMLLNSTAIQSARKTGFANGCQVPVARIPVVAAPAVTPGPTTDTNVVGTACLEPPDAPCRSSPRVEQAPDGKPDGRCPETDDDHAHATHPPVTDRA